MTEGGEMGWNIFATRKILRFVLELERFCVFVGVKHKYVTPKWDTYIRQVLDCRTAAGELKLQ